MHHIIVTQEYESTLFTGHDVLWAKPLVLATTVLWKLWCIHQTTEAEAVSELLGEECFSIERVREYIKP